MARFYIKDLIKSMLKLDEQNLMLELDLKDEGVTREDCKSQSVVSLCSKTSENDDIGDESTSLRKCNTINRNTSLILIYIIFTSLRRFRILETI